MNLRAHYETNGELGAFLPVAESPDAMASSTPPSRLAVARWPDLAELRRFDGPAGDNREVAQ